VPLAATVGQHGGNLQKHTKQRQKVAASTWSDFDSENLCDHG